MEEGTLPEHITSANSKHLLCTGHSARHWAYKEEEVASLRSPRSESGSLENSVPPAETETRVHSGELPGRLPEGGDNRQV